MLLATLNPTDDRTVQLGRAIGGASGSRSADSLGYIVKPPGRWTSSPFLQFSVLCDETTTLRSLMEDVLLHVAEAPVQHRRNGNTVKVAVSRSRVFLRSASAASTSAATTFVLHSVRVLADTALPAAASAPLATRANSPDLFDGQLDELVFPLCKGQSKDMRRRSYPLYEQEVARGVDELAAVTTNRRWTPPPIVLLA